MFIFSSQKNNTSNQPVYIYMYHGRCEFQNSERKSQLQFKRPSIVLFLCYVYFSLSSKFSYLDIYIFVKNIQYHTEQKYDIMPFGVIIVSQCFPVLLKLVEYTFFDNAVDKTYQLCGILMVYFIIINWCRFSGLKNTHLLIHNFVCPKLGTIHLVPVFKLSQG